MKYYDYDKARRIIEAEKEGLDRADLGIHEDWFWTADTIYEDGKYVRDIPSNEKALKANEKYKKMVQDPKLTSEDRYKKSKKFNHLIGGILGSAWATPTILLQYKDGRSIFYECFHGEVGREKSLNFEMGFGCLSKPVQDSIAKLEKWEE